MLTALVQLRDWRSEPCTHSANPQSVQVLLNPSAASSTVRRRCSDPRCGASCVAALNKLRCLPRTRDLLLGLHCK